MYKYILTEDGIGCAIEVHRPGDELPEGWQLVPAHLENRPLWVVNGELTDQKPLVLIDHEMEREAAQANLKADMIELILTLSYNKIDAHIENVFGTLSNAQKNSLKTLYKTVLFLAKEHPEALRNAVKFRGISLGAILQ